MPLALRRTRLALVLVTLAAGACNGSSAVATGPVALGAPISSDLVASDVTLVRWSPDGAELWYVTASGAGQALKAVNAVTHAERTVVARAAGGFHYFDFSADGARAWFSATSSGGADELWKVQLSGAGLAVTDTIPTLRVFVLSADETLLSDFAYLRNRSTHAARLFPLVFSFSPSGASVTICCSVGLQKVRLADSVTTSFPLTTAVVGASVRWQGEQLSFLYSTYALTADGWSMHLGLMNDVTFADHTVADFTGLPVTSVRAAWSPDGTRAAAWVPLAGCAPDDAMGGCPLRYTLRVMRTDVTSSVAVVGPVIATEAARPVALTFSPEGRRVAFVFGGKVYVQAVP